MVVVSLVNTMLRDLDRRRAAESERGAIPNEVRPLPEAGAPGNGLALAASVIAVLAIGVGAWWWLSPAKVPAGEVPAPVAAIAPTAGARPPPVPPEAAVPPASPAPLAESTAVALLPSAPVVAPRVPDPPPVEAVVEAAPAPVRRTDALPDKATPKEPPQASLEVSRPSPGRLKLAGELTARPGSAAPRAAAPAAKPADPNLPVVPSPDDDWRQAQTLLRDGHPEQAEPVLKRILQTQPANVAARNAMLGILLPARRNAEAGEVLKDGLAQRPVEIGWAINLARIHAMGNDYVAAWEVLERSLPHAEANAEFRAFCGTVLQRLNRNGESIAHYQAALKLNPREPRWWVGLGIALESTAKPAEAREAYLHAQNLGGLSAELAGFVAQKLK